MKKAIILTLLCLFLAIVILPALVVLRGQRQEVKVDTSGSPLINVLNVKTKEIEVLPLEEYIVGVVAAEMPVDFETEALKAQAVAARTYTIKRYEAARKTLIRSP